MCIHINGFHNAAPRLPVHTVFVLQLMYGDSCVGESSMADNTSARARAAVRDTPEGVDPSGDALPSLHDQIEVVGWGRFQVTALIAFVLFVVSEAMEVTVPNVLWAEIKGGSVFGPAVEGHSATWRAIVTGAPMLGNLCGAVFGGALADTHGRHAAIHLHSALFVAASLASGLSQDESSFVASRVVLGVSLGILLPVVLSYMAELAPAGQRARAVVIIPGFGFPSGQILMLMFGLLLHSYSVGTEESAAASSGDGGKHTGDEGQGGLRWWRVMLTAGIVPNLVALMIVRCYVPESVCVPPAALL